MASDDEKQIALTHLAQGKRHFAVKDYFEAVSSFALACECLAKIYGDDANECGDAYFNYGKALLELSRGENDVLGNAVAEEAGKDQDESGDEDADGDKEETEVKPDQNGNASGEPSTPADEESKVEVGDGDTDNIDSSTDLKKGEASEAKTNGENGALDPTAENDDEEEDDASNLKLAWEILELAKSIFKKQVETDKSVNLKLAEVHLLLGEVGLESENFTQGTEDMLTCLELQKENLEPDNRRIAETYYQLGLCYGMANRFDEAIDAYTKCADVLQARIINLKNCISRGVKPEGDDPFYSFEGEITDLESLFSEIQDKILDMKDFKNETKKLMIKATLNEGSDPGAGSSNDPTFPTPSASVGSQSTSSSADITKPVTNIGHLVRKKPRPEIESESNESENVKRVCTEKDKKQ